MLTSRNGWMLPALCALLWTAGATAQPASTSSPSLSDQRNAYGITLALKGQAARAESAFVALLSSPTADARAFNNLGNIHFLRGEFDVALAFYDRAARADSLDAGVQLNRAAGFMMKGDEYHSREAATEGVRLAGGEAAAARLLGLKADDAKPKPLAAEGAWLTKDEVRAMINSARKSVPAESTRTQATRGPAQGAGSGASPASTKATAGKPKRARGAWTSAGPRGADGADAAMVLYWMR